MLFLLVESISTQKLQWLEFRHHSEEELVLLVFEEEDTLNDLSMCA